MKNNSLNNMLTRIIMLQQIRTTVEQGWTWSRAVGEETCKVLRQRKVYRAI